MTSTRFWSCEEKSKRRMPGLKTFVKTKKKEIKEIMTEMNDIALTADPNMLVVQKVKHIEQRKIATGNLENINSNILYLYHQTDELNKQKTCIYDMIHGRQQNRSPPNSNLVIGKGSYMASTQKSNLWQVLFPWTVVKLIPHCYSQTSIHLHFKN
ncbi:hypothetical protein BC941DRAFT_456885 [Chlamydoabsidia padenii]|nr:hypothetical protein BC941DRAFT_456885 [Chlamydoabsidia padenii]